MHAKGEGPKTKVGINRLDSCNDNDLVQKSCMCYVLVLV